MSFDDNDDENIKTKKNLGVSNFSIAFKLCKFGLIFVKTSSDSPPTALVKLISRTI